MKNKWFVRQLKNLIFRVHTTPLGQKVLCQPSSFSLLVAASISSSLPPGPQTALTHLLEASLHCIPSSALSSVTLPPAFDCGSTEGGVVCILLSRLANCLVPGAQGLINDNCNAQEIEGKGRKGPGANIDLEDDQMERGLASMDEDFPEGRQENTETESSSQSVSTSTSTHVTIKPARIQHTTMHPVSCNYASTTNSINMTYNNPQNHTLSSVTFMPVPVYTPNNKNAPSVPITPTPATSSSAKVTSAQ